MSEEFMFVFTKHMESEDRARLAELVSEGLGYPLVKLGYFENTWDTLAVRQGYVFDHDSTECNSSTQTSMVHLDPTRR